MTTAVQRRRGTNTEHATFTGLDGEITVNTTTYTLHVHDGATVGGIVLAKADGSNIVTSSIDINGGTIDGTVIGGSSAAAGSFTTISASGEIAANGGVAFGDNDKAIFGAGSDLQIYHDASHSFIKDAGTGHLKIQATNLKLQDVDGNNYIDCIDGSYVRLMHNTATKLETTSTGIDVTGEITADALTINSAGVQIGTILQSTSTISSRLALLDANTTSASQVGIGATGNTLGLYAAGGVPKVVVSATGIDVTGTASADQLNSNNGKLFLDDNGSHNGVINAPASLYVNFDSDNTSASEKIVFGYDRDGTSGGTSVMEISSTGIDVTGTVTADGLTVENTGSASTLTLTKTDGSAFTASAGNYSILGTDDSTNLYFKTNGSFRQLINSNGDISFYEDTGTTAKFFWDASAESLGIGTSSPAAKLHVDDGTGAALFVGLSSNIYYRGLEHIWQSQNNTAERMRIDSSGNVGIGVVPESWTYFSPIQAKRSSFAGSDGQTGVGYNWYFDGAYKYIANDYALAYQQNATSGVHSWSTAASGTADNTISWSESMRIDSSGNLLVGTTSINPGQNNTTTGTAILVGGRFMTQNAGSDNIMGRNTDGVLLSIRRAGAEVGTISVTTTATTYNTSSDQRLKENIADANDAGDKIDAIKVRQYDWKADGSHQDYGMVAQELMTVAPEAVSGDPESDEMMGVDYSKLVPMLVKEIQSLRARVAQLEGAN